MKPSKNIPILAGGMLICLMAVFGSSETAWAAENDWRPTYDLVMRWVNFLILVALLYKLLKTPLKDFFKSQRETTAREIEAVEAEKKAADTRIAETRKLLEGGEERFKEIRERIVRQGETARAQIVDDARQQSRIMIAEAKRRIDSQMVRAKAQIRSELVDTAVDEAMKRLPAEINEKDTAKFVDQFITGAKHI